MKIRKHTISFAMIALLVLMQLVSPFLHAHIADSNDASTYEMHFHGDTGHDDDTTTASDVVHFETIASYVAKHNQALTKTIMFKKSEPIALVQNEFKLVEETAEAVPPPIILPSFNKPASIGFMALAPPLV